MTAHIRLTLVRDDYQPERTMGRLEYGGERVLETMEPGRDEDHPCVPTGFYYLARHDSTRYGRTWALVGEHVSHWLTAGIPRYAILFHSGNWDEDSRGCILVGLSRTEMRGEPALADSREAMERLRKLIRDEDAFLVVKEG